MFKKNLVMNNGERVCGQTVNVKSLFYTNQTSKDFKHFKKMHLHCTNMDQCLRFSLFFVHVFKQHFRTFIPDMGEL